MPRRSPRSSRPLAATFVAAAVAVSLSACGGSAPSAPPVPTGSPVVEIPGDPAQAVVERDGVRVILRLDRDRAAVGQAVLATVVVANTGVGPIIWQGGGCDLLNGFALVGPDLPPVRAGRDWPGVAGLVKLSAGTGDRQHGGFVDPRSGGESMACPADLRINELQPGPGETATAAWFGRTTDTLPTPAGAYVARYTFPYIDRRAADGFLGDPFGAVRPMTVEVPFEVVGPTFAGLSAGEAIDAALEDSRLAGWLGGLPRERLGGATVRLDGSAWRLRITALNPEVSVEVLIDASTGQVSAVDLG